MTHWTHLYLEAFCMYDSCKSKTMRTIPLEKVKAEFEKGKKVKKSDYKVSKNPMYVDEKRPAGRQAVRGKFHHERRRLAFEERLAEKLAHPYREDDADGVHDEYHGPRVVREKRARKENVDRQAGGTAYQRVYQDSNQPVGTRLKRPGGHYRGRVAAEA